MRPLTLHDFYDAEGSTLTLTDPDPEDEPLPLTEEKRLLDGPTPDVSNDGDMDFESR